jgi:chlorobactene glucosyltransferase
MSGSDLFPAAVFSLPWALFALYAAVLVHRPRRLTPPDPDATGSQVGGSGHRALPVSIVVPARNEARNIETCLESLTALEYPDFEILVVDDRSEDQTAQLARRVPRLNAKAVRVIEGEPLPPGWFGKPWACAQGAREARNELLLFTDADTVHAPDLLSAAVEALDDDEADAVTLVGSQILSSFWERLVQPHFFFSLALRFRDPRQPLPPSRSRDAIANGQYILIRRTTYDQIDGHGAVQGEVVEDLRLAQILVAAGKRLSLREAPGRLRTRMYTSLREIVAGWSKNTATAARQTFGPVLGRVALPLAVVVMAVLWIAPPLILMGTLWLGGPNAWVLWGASVVAMSAILWSAVSWAMGAPFRYGPLYPLGAIVAAFILLRSWIRGSRISWKGRTYVSPPSASSITP